MMDAGGLGAMAAGGFIGGTASYATGGEFTSGAMAGSLGGFAARGISRTLRGNSKMYNAQLAKTASGEGVGSTIASQVMKHQGSVSNAITQRRAMMAGAGLFGVAGGGNRNNHRRGFNAHRGNTF